MINLDFQRMIIDEFKTYRGKHTFRFADFGMGVHFVRGKNLLRKRLGSNGSGKSTLWDALSWCLTGRTVRELRNPDVQPRGFKGRTRVRLDISGTKIERTVNPNKLLMNGDVVSQEQIDAFLGLNFELLNHTVIMGQSRPLFFDLDAKGKMQLFVDILNLDRWEARSELASDRAKAFDRECSTLEGELLVLRAQEAEFQKDYDRSKAMRDEWERIRATRLDDADSEIKNLEGIILDQEEQIGRASLALDSAETELKQLIVDLEKAERCAVDAGAAFSARDRVVQAAHLRADELQDDLDGLGKGVKCPTCGGVIHDAAKRRAELRFKIDELRSERVSKKLTHAKNDTADVNIRLAAAKREFESKAREARDVLDLKRPSLEQIKARLAIVKARKDHGIEEINPHAESTSVARKRLRKATAAIEETIEAVEILKVRIARAKFWIKGFKDIRLMVVEETLQELELAANALLEDVGLSGWRLLFGTARETQKGTKMMGINVSILEPDWDKPVRWEAWSGGEAQRLRLVGALALSEVLLANAGVATNMEILDEPTQHLSPEGTRDVCDFLVERARIQKRQTFYSDHQSVDSSKFASVVTIVRDKQGSHING